MKALVFAAGLGTRLRPITDTIPKALVPVRGVPMLQRVICRLRDAGISDFVVNACYFREKVIGFLESTDLGVHVAVSVEDESEPLETGGGIKKARPLLEDGGSGRFLVHNADILSDLDVRWFLGEDRRLCNGADEPLATLLVHDAEAERYLLFDDGMNLVGWTNVRTGEVKSPYPGLEPERCRRFSFCGIHVISEKIFPLMEDWPDRFPIMDFYLKNCDSHRIAGVVAGNLNLIDIGSPEKLAEAERSEL